VQAVSGSPLTIHGEGTQRRQFTYVEDIAHLIAQAAFLKQQEYHVFNLGGDDIYSVSELVSEVEAVSGRRLDVKRGSVGAGTHHVQVVHDRSRCIFGKDGFIKLRDGLTQTYNWATSADLDARSQLQSFHAEILEPGGGGLAAVIEHAGVVEVAKELSVDRDQLLRVAGNGDLSTVV
jgi:UDP-glucose 4-epimerase